MGAGRAVAPRRPVSTPSRRRRFSRRSAAGSSRSLLVRPSRSPASTSACFTQSRTAVSVRSKSLAICPTDGAEPLISDVRQSGSCPSPAGGRVRWIRRCVGAAVFGVEALGFFELVFEDDDAAGGLDGGAVVDEFAGAGGDPQLVAGVAAVSARGAERGDEAGFADGAEKTLRGAEHLGGPAHGVG